MTPAPDVLRPNPVRAATALARELDFTYAQYDALLGRLAQAGASIVALRDYVAAPGDNPIVGLRHDVDSRLDSALALARLEHRRGIRSTYFVLHTAAYYSHDDALLRVLRTMQDDYGHEIGWHNDLVTVQVLDGVDAVGYLHSELDWLRANGVEVTGTAAHGARACHELGYTNRYFFSDFPSIDDEMPNRDAVVVDGRRIEVPHARLADFGLTYEATQLPRDRYYSDATYDARGRRWHTSLLRADDLRANERTIVLVHPCLWDRSAAARLVRESGRLGRRAIELLSSR